MLAGEAVAFCTLRTDNLSSSPVRDRLRAGPTRYRHHRQSAAGPTFMREPCGFCLSKTRVFERDKLTTACEFSHGQQERFSKEHGSPVKHSKGTASGNRRS
jgi:hypothetical protein